MTKERIIGFDLARVVAILVIIGFYHNLGYAGKFHSEPSVRVFVYSALGVFTFLSAFLLASRSVFSGIREILSFYKKRILRIWPLFVLSSLLLALIGFNAWSPTIKGIVGISPFWAPHPTTMWYVAMLISLYFITPFVLHGNLFQQCMKAFGVMAIIGMLQIFIGTVVPRTFNYFTVYLVGLLLGKNFFEQTLSFLRSRGGRCISLAWCVLVVLVYLTKSVYLKSFSSVVGIIAILNLSLLVADILRSHKLFLQAISILSYSSFCAYLFHREIIWTLFKLYKPNGFLPIFFEVLVVGVPLSFLCAYYIQKYYDMLLERIKR